MSALGLVALSLLEMALAYGVWRALVFGLYRLGCLFMACHDVQGLGSLFIALPVAVVIACAYWFGALYLRARWRPRFILDGVALVVSIVGYVVGP